MSSLLGAALEAGLEDDANLVVVEVEVFADALEEALERDLPDGLAGVLPIVAPHEHLFRLVVEPLGRAPLWRRRVDNVPDLFEVIIAIVEMDGVEGIGGGGVKRQDDGRAENARCLRQGV